MRPRGDTVIVGGGVIGLALAFELLRREARRVVVVERARPGSGATRAAGGMLAPVSEAETEDADTIALGLDSLSRYPQVVEDVERIASIPTGFDVSGTLWVACRRDDRAEIDRCAAALAPHGPGIERLSGEAVRRLEPRLSGRVESGIRVPGEGQIDPRRFAAALARAVAVLGGRILSDTAVTAIEGGSSGCLTVRARDSAGASLRVDATEVVLAAGAWSFRDITGPIADPGLRPIKGQLVRLRGPRLLRHVVRTPRTYLLSRADGELLVGATVEEMGFDDRPTAGAIVELLRGAWEVLPSTEDLAFVETSVGFRSALDDHRPRIGPTKVEGLFLAVGHYRNGVLLAPATAAYLADAIVDRRTPAAIAPFEPERAIQSARSVEA